MARTVVPWIEVNTDTAVVLVGASGAQVSGSPANGHYCANDGAVWLLVQNTVAAPAILYIEPAGSSATVAPSTTPGHWTLPVVGVPGAGQVLTNLAAFTILASGTVMLGPFAPNSWNNASTLWFSVDQTYGANLRIQALHMIDMK